MVRVALIALFVLVAAVVAAWRFDVLPNPFAKRGRDVYRVVGAGLRYRFSLETAE